MQSPASWIWSTTQGMRFFCTACAVISLLVTVIVIQKMSSRGFTYVILGMVYNHPRDTFRLLQSLRELFLLYCLCSGRSASYLRYWPIGTI